MLKNFVMFFVSKTDDESDFLNQICYPFPHVDSGELQKASVATLLTRPTCD